MEGFMEKAVSQLGLERWDKICLGRDRRKNLPVEDDDMSLFIFQIEYYGGLSLWQALIMFWVRVWVLRTNTQTPTLLFPAVLGVGISCNTISEAGWMETDKLESKSPV